MSDLHLWEQQPELEQLFQHFMQEQASEADELYVLGDLFEAWIGDDATNPMAERVINAFSQFSNRGGKLFFLHGNRDFLLGSDFAKATGGIILQEPHKMRIAGKKAILMHGDSLCTADKEYISFRNQVRSEQWQQQFLAQSVEQRQKIARDIRDSSQARGKDMNEEISDVAADEVNRIMTEYDVCLLIHGHTHRQARYPLTINNLSAERIVLGDWGATGSVLIAEDDNIHIHNFKLS
ncbi:MAG: UDP-2,3-diacylglucosamine diphosphatase [Gammaproteobacteria bacterium]|nr:UDP-2,3-diacylglucosamine diphosphatase [Gammaproteobacteria bacterium]